jgi:hypothetical protein
MEGVLSSLLCQYVVFNAWVTPRYCVYKDLGSYRKYLEDVLPDSLASAALETNADGVGEREFDAAVQLDGVKNMYIEEAISRLREVGKSINQQL